MARKSQLVPVMSRDSRTADRPGPAASSPFRSSKAATRIKAARAMIEKRQGEIEALTRALDAAEAPKIQKILTTRLLASRNNLRSWEDYIRTYEREPRAVITLK